MAKCEVCGNEYDKTFELIAAGARHTFRQLRMRDPGNCSHLRALPLPRHRARSRSQRAVLLLRTLREGCYWFRRQRSSRVISIGLAGNLACEPFPKRQT